MNISNDSDGSLNVHDVALLHQQLFGLGAYRLDDGFRQKVLLVEGLYASIEVNRSWNR
jgi:hypothetical protein